jgi:hypothetical protein
MWNNYSKDFMPINSIMGEGGTVESKNCPKINLQLVCTVGNHGLLQYLMALHICIFNTKHTQSLCCNKWLDAYL